MNEWHPARQQQINGLSLNPSGCLFPITAFGYNSFIVQQSLRAQQSLAYDVRVHIQENLTASRTGHFMEN